MDTVSPIVDCGVHYVDVMCAMVGGGLRPVRVSGIGARLTEDLRQPDMYARPRDRFGLHFLRKQSSISSKDLEIHAPLRRCWLYSKRLHTNDDCMHRGRYNYGQLQVTFEDGSVGWYECGWGPMMSETAFFGKFSLPFNSH